MHEHPILGTVLFGIGAALVAITYANANAGGDASIAALFLGHVLALNGVLLAVLGTDKNFRPIPRRF